MQIPKSTVTLPNSFDAGTCVHNHIPAYLGVAGKTSLASPLSIHRRHVLIYICIPAVCFAKNKISNKCWIGLNCDRPLTRLTAYSLPWMIFALHPVNICFSHKGQSNGYVDGKTEYKSTCLNWNIICWNNAHRKYDINPTRYN